MLEKSDCQINAQSRISSSMIQCRERPVLTNVRNSAFGPDPTHRLNLLVISLTYHQISVR